MDFKNAIAQTSWQFPKLNDINHAVESFTTELVTIALDTIPNTLATVHSCDKLLYNSYLKRLGRVTFRLYNIFKANRTPSNHSFYKESLRTYQLEMKRLQYDYNNSKFI